MSKTLTVATGSRNSEREPGIPPLIRAWVRPAVWDVHGARISDPVLDQILERGGGFLQFAPGSQLAWRLTDLIDMNSSHKFFWGWMWLSDAEAATNDRLLTDAASRV